MQVEDIVALANAMVEADAFVDAAETALKAMKERARQLREEAIPCAMQELGITELKLDTGEKLSVKQDVFAAIPVDGKGAAYAWLTDNGFDGLIKTKVTTEFGRGAFDEAVALASELVERGVGAELTQDVHAQTLKAFLREQLAAANSVPLDLFGARPIWVSKITKK